MSNKKFLQDCYDLLQILNEIRVSKRFRLKPKISYIFIKTAYRITEMLAVGFKMKFLVCGFFDKINVEERHCAQKTLRRGVVLQVKETEIQ